MSVWAALLLLATVFATSTLSGVFGMVGGLILMGALALLMPVAPAMVTHGVVQFVSNGWRAVLLRGHLRWRIVAVYALGAGLAAATFASLAWVPSKPLVFALLGLLPILAWLPKTAPSPNAARPLDAIACGFSVTAVNVLAGVSGPLLDVFFVRTTLTRQEIVATKAATQVLAHSAKVLVYAPLLLAQETPSGLPPAWVIGLAMALSMAGGALGARILDRLTDRGFLAWSRWLVTATGLVYLVWAAVLWEAEQ